MGLFIASNVHNEASLTLSFMKLLGLYPAGCCSAPGIGYVYVLIFLLMYNVFFVTMTEYTTSVLDELDLAFGVVKARRIRYSLNMIILHLIVISTCYHSTKVKLVCEEIDIVDKGLKYLNIRIDHTSSMKKDAVRIFNIILIALLLNMMEYYSLWNYQRDYMYVLMWILDRIPDFINNILICSYATLVTKLTLRFEKVNQALETIIEDQNYLAIYKPMQKSSAFRWKLLKVLNMKLRKTMVLISTAYGFQFLLLSAVYFIFACLHCDTVYSYMNNRIKAADVMISSFWGIFDLAKLIYIVNSYRILIKQYA